jgi:hypothetical protein
MLALLLGYNRCEPHGDDVTLFQASTTDAGNATRRAVNLTNRIFTGLARAFDSSVPEERDT